MKETKNEVVDLKKALTDVGAVKEYAGERFGFAPWVVEPVAVSKEGPASWCSFEAMGLLYSVENGFLSIEEQRVGER